ncbi:MAG TPA: adenylate kinase [Ignavibacteriaceae bacterium]|nr:adenylate kinase [Ignavibacteriaceae bacterium]
MRLLLFGAPGVGKGTQAKLLSAKFNIPHISTGDILRQAVKDETDLGKKAQEIMSRGDLVPDDVMLGIIKYRFSKSDCNDGFILDGFPRTTNQAVELDKLLQEMNINDIKLINIYADEEEIVKRLNSRRACKECGNIFTLSEIENSVSCPNCKARNSFYLRDDDKEEVIRNRMEIFRKTTEPVLKHYAKQGKVISINGLGSVEEVNVELLKILAD